MKGTTASQGTRRDSRPASERWPRVGATLSNGTVVVRPLARGEQPAPALRRAVLLAEPCERFPTVETAAANAAAVLTERLRRKANGAVEVLNALESVSA